MKSTLVKSLLCLPLYLVLVAAPTSSYSEDQSTAVEVKKADTSTEAAKVANGDISKSNGTQEAPVAEQASTATNQVSTVKPTTKSAVIPYKTQEIDVGAQFTRTMVTISVLCIIAFGILMWLKKRLVKQGKLPESVGQHIKVIDRQRISNNTQVYLMNVDGKNVLLAEGSSGETMLQLTDENSKT